MTQVHKETLDKIDNALASRDHLDVEIFGMEGIPEDAVASHKQRVVTQFAQAEAERRAVTGNPAPGSAAGNAAKKPKFEPPSEMKQRLAEHKAKVAAEQAAQSAGPTGAEAPPMDGQNPGFGQAPGFVSTPHVTYRAALRTAECSLPSAIWRSARRSPLWFLSTTLWPAGAGFSATSPTLSWRSSSALWPAELLASSTISTGERCLRSSDSIPARSKPAALSKWLSCSSAISLFLAAGAQSHPNSATRYVAATTPEQLTYCARSAATPGICRTARQCIPDAADASGPDGRTALLLIR